MREATSWPTARKPHFPDITEPARMPQDRKPALALLWVRHDIRVSIGRVGT